MQIGAQVELPLLCSQLKLTSAQRRGHAPGRFLNACSGVYQHLFWTDNASEVLLTGRL